MSFLRRDIHNGFGCPYYVPVGKWNSKIVPSPLGPLEYSCVYGVIANAITANDIDDFTKNIYITVETLTNEGAKQTTIANIGFDEDDIVEDFVSLYFERLVMQPYYDNDDGVYNSYSRLSNVAKSEMRINKYKYLKLLETLGYTYDPTANYDMVETSGDAEKEGKLDQKKTIQGDKVTTESAPEIKSSEYTTTFDDDTTGRLKGYVVQEYNGTYPVDGNVPVKITKERYEGTNPGEVVTSEHSSQASLTMDNITTPTADKAKVHKLIRKGNIGVTSTQELIEKQRDLVRISLEQEILNDLEKVLLLNSY